MIRRILIGAATIISLLCSLHSMSYDSSASWTDLTQAELDEARAGCIYPSQINLFDKASLGINIKNPSEDKNVPPPWQSTGLRVEEGKSVQMNWRVSSLHLVPRKYRVMYRIDPRFTKPQIFLQRYDYGLKKYVSDFHDFKSGVLPSYQTDGSTITTDQEYQDKIRDLTDYFNFASRDKIFVQSGDVVNIKLIDAGDFFEGDFADQLEFNSDSDITNIETRDLSTSGKLIYSSASTWCQKLQESSASSSGICSSNTYFNSANYLHSITGRIIDGKFSDLMTRNVIQPCPQGENTKDLDNLCYYDRGRGMNITAAGRLVKAQDQSFMESSGQQIAHFISHATGNLEFGTGWQIDGMFSLFNQSMRQWSVFAGIDDLNNYIAGGSPLEVDLSMNFLHFGSYFMEIEIGSSTNTIDLTSSGIGVEYAISDTLPGPNAGTPTPRADGFIAPNSGNLYVRAQQTNWQDIISDSAQIQFEASSYTGGTEFSDIVYNKIIKPITSSLQSLSRIIYENLVRDATLSNIAKIMLTLYVIFYGLFFLVGAAQFTLYEFATRIFKIVIIVILFSETSWHFFNEYLFQMFYDGISTLIGYVTGVQGASENIFTFIDPIFRRLTNEDLWLLLFVQLLQFWNGMFLFSIMIIYSMLIYTRGVIEVLVSYCIAFVSLSVMTSLAPVLIIFMLFSKTQNIFSNWLSIMFSNLISPTILVIFFLFMDQFIADNLVKAVPPACWGEFIKLGFFIDLFGIPLDKIFPFISKIKFYVSEPTSITTLVSSTLLFFIYCKIVAATVNYVNSLTGMLTHVIPAMPGQHDKGAGSSNPTANIVGDIAKYSGANMIKNRVIDPAKRTVKRAAIAGVKKVGKAALGVGKAAVGGVATVTGLKTLNKKAIAPGAKGKSALTAGNVALSETPLGSPSKGEMNTKAGKNLSSAGHKGADGAKKAGGKLASVAQKLRDKINKYGN